MPDEIEQTTQDTKKETKRLFIGACIVAAIIVALHFTPLKHLVDVAQRFKADIDRFGWKADALFALGSVVVIALGFPRLLLCGISGILFGFMEGLLLSQFASVTGSYGAFLLTRLWAPKQWVKRKLANSERLRPVLAHPSVLSIFIARQLPVPGIVPNVLLGVLATRHLTFLVGTFIGYLPSNIPVALAGSSVGKDSLEKAFTQASVSMISLAVFGVLIMWVRRKYCSPVSP
jgi:uncharacterized membrane protein YdjX (TVP38/TMEM64 family)